MNLMPELRDQLLHLSAGCILVLIFVQFMPVIGAAFIAMTTGVVREIYQRYDRGRAWHDCQAGCRRDLISWAAGVLMGAGFIWMAA